MIRTGGLTPGTLPFGPGGRIGPGIAPGPFFRLFFAEEVELVDVVFLASRHPEELAALFQGEFAPLPSADFVAEADNPTGVVCGWIYGDRFMQWSVTVVAEFYSFVGHVSLLCEWGSMCIAPEQRSLS